MSTPLQTLVPLSEYRAQRSHVFRSDDSLRWFVRQHSDELIKRGALVLLGRQKMAAPESFDSVAFEIGGRLASARGSGA